MKVTLHLIIRTEKFDSKTLLKILSNQFLKFTKFGRTEPLKNKIDLESLEAISELYEDDLSIILGGNKYTSFSGDAWPNGFLLLGGVFELKKKEVNDIHNLFEFVNAFSNNESLLYGYVCSEDEYDDKHKVVDEYSHSWKGVSTWDYEEFLPGVHWYTIFGKELVNAIGKEKFECLKNVSFVDVGDESLAFHLNTPIDKLEDRQKELIEIEKQLGESYFFGKEKEEGAYAHSGAYKEYLKAFGRGY